MPCSTRKAMRASMFHAELERIEPTMKRASALIHVCLAPKRSIAQPLTGTTIASASRQTFGELVHFEELRPDRQEVPDRPCRDTIEKPRDGP
jgi:hypothetical protein